MVTPTPDPLIPVSTPSTPTAGPQEPATIVPSGNPPPAAHVVTTGQHKEGEAGEMARLRGERDQLARENQELKDWKATNAAAPVQDDGDWFSKL